MKSILILANNDVGLYKFRKELIKELIDSGNKVYISLPFGKMVLPLKEMGCEFIDTTIDRREANPFKDIKLVLFYKNIMRKIKPDIVLTYTIKPNIYGGIICRILNIDYMPNITGLGSAVEKEGVLQKITVFLYRIALKKAKCVFFQNKHNLDFFKDRKIINSKYRLIPGSGVNLNDFNYYEYPNEQRIRFLFVARIMKEKGIDQYLEASKYITEKYPNTEFNIVGACEEEYLSILNEMSDKNIIKYYGLQNDVRPFYKKSHCIIHPTYYPEGMSNVLLESAACGRPFITTDRSGCREIVDNGINGYIVRQRDSKDLIEKIIEFIKLPHIEKINMGIRGREKMQKEFDRQVVIKAYIEEIGDAKG